MSVKFDGTNVKRGSSTVGNLKSGDILREGSSSGGKALGNIKSRNLVRDGSSSGGKALCNILDGRNIREGSSSGGRQLIKIQAAAKAIGTSAQGPSTALVWYFFAR